MGESSKERADLGKSVQSRRTWKVGMKARTGLGNKGVKMGGRGDETIMEGDLGKA